MLACLLVPSFLGFVYTAISKINGLTSDFLVLLLSQSFCPSSMIFPEPCMQERGCIYPQGLGYAGSVSLCTVPLGLALFPTKNPSIKWLVVLVLVTPKAI